MSNYNNLTQCETLEGQCPAHPPALHTHIHNADCTTHPSEIDFRLQLSSTDYGSFLANEPLPISTATIADKVRQLTVPPSFP